MASVGRPMNVGAAAHAAAQLGAILDGRLCRPVEPGIFSVLPADSPGQRYDRRARMYDRLIGSRLYNRIAWGCTPDAYHAFARRAVEAAADGWLLDAGCGTLLFTADLYAATPDRLVVALDNSLGMLRAARDRLIDVAGVLPAHVVFLQADMHDLPFMHGRFRTVLSMGMLHLFEDPPPVLAALQECLARDGQLFLTSLVENGRVGDRYMRLLHRAGELAPPRTSAALLQLLRQTLREPACSVHGNMVYSVSTANLD